MKTVLWVDDDASALGGMAAAVTRELGVEVAFASTLAVAERKLRAEHYDLILLDLELVDETSLPILRDVRKGVYPGVRRDVSVILLSGHGLEVVRSALDEARLSEAGVRFLVKPCTPHALLSAIAEGL